VPPMNHRLMGIAAALLIAFGIIAFSLTYWGVFAPDLLNREDNPRRVEAERAIGRGAIYDRAGERLAWSDEVGVSPSGLPVFVRSYSPTPQPFAVIGYASLRYGVGGIEAAFDPELRGTLGRAESDRFWGEFFHQPPHGASLQLTLDADLQRRLYAAFGSRHGAAVVIELPSGAVRALVTVPGVDPSVLENTFETLAKDPAAPLLNRALQGDYQPGGALQPLILAALLNADPAPPPIPTEAGDPSATLTIGALRLACLSVPPTPLETLDQALRYGCPTPFAAAFAADWERADEVWATLTNMGLTQTPSLSRLPTASGRIPAVWGELGDPLRLQREVVGQGALTVTPLQMALATAILAQDGAALTPYLVTAVYPPERDATADITRYGEAPSPYSLTPLPLETAVITAAAAGGVRAAMPPQAGVDHAHTAIAYTGASSQVWFLGFGESPDGRTWVIAIVVEESDQVDEAVRVAAAGFR